MNWILSFILFITISATIIWIIDIILTGYKDIKRQPEILEKVIEQTKKENHQEIIFKQFSNFILSLFNTKDEISKSELLNKLSTNFPYYGNGLNEIYSDLRKANLIAINYGGEENLRLGKAFKNLRLTNNDLIDFMKMKCETDKFECTHLDNFVISEIEIYTKIDGTNYFFSFGACTGRLISEKIKIDSTLIDHESFYMYCKSYEKISSRNKIDSIAFQNHIKLSSNVDYRSYFNSSFIYCVPL